MVDNKTCAKCGINKPVSDFLTDKRTKTIAYRSPCKQCMNEYNTKYRKANRNKYNADARRRRNDRKKRAIEYKGGKCEHCGNTYHTAAFDFHHKNPAEKDKDPGLMMGLTDKNLFKELDKCILLCSNCHRILHYEETNTT